MLPLLAVAWLNGAIACVGVAAGPLTAPVAVGNRYPDGADDLSSHQGHHHDGARDDVAHGAPPAAAGPAQGHPDCIHCPPSASAGEIESGHVLCAAADGAQPTATANLPMQWDSKPLLSPIAWTAPVAAAQSPRIGPRAARDRAIPHPRPLNVHYCVFLN